jgi:hypothetical protein
VAVRPRHGFLPRRVVAVHARAEEVWLIPVLIMFVVFGALIVLTQGSVVAPSIYTLF